MALIGPFTLYSILSGTPVSLPPPPPHVFHPLCRFPLGCSYIMRGELRYSSRGQHVSTYITFLVDAFHFRLETTA